MEPSNVQTLRYGTDARVRDILLVCPVALLAPWVTIAPFVRLPPSAEVMVAASGGVLAAIVFLVARWRWSAWVRVDALGLTTGRGSGDPVQQLGWSELQEIGLLRNGGLVLHGEDVVIRLGPDLAGLESLRLRILRTWGAQLYRRRREAFRRGETLEFHGPESPAWAATKGILWTLCVGMPLALTLGQGSPLLGVFSFPVFTSLLIHRLVRACERIRLNGEGLEIRRLTTVRLPWGDIARAALLHDSRLAIGGPKMGILTVSPQISNFLILQEIVLERAGPGSPGVPSA